MTVGTVTNRYQSLLELTPAQVAAVEVLDAGGTQQEAAAAAGVNRVTVTRWVRNHPAFIAELNRRKVERADNLAARSENVTLTALEVVERAVQAGDLAAALAWIRMTHGPGRPGPQEVPRHSAPMTPQAVIDAVAQATAVNETIGLMIGMYQDEALNQIQAALEG